MNSRASPDGMPESANVTVRGTWMVAAWLLSSAVTIPVSVRYVGGGSIFLALSIGLIPALPLVVAVVTVVASYLAAVLVALGVTIGRVLRHNYTSVECVDDLLGWIINPLICLLTQQPYEPPQRASERRAAQEMTPLPAVPVSAGIQGEEIYFQTVLDMAAKPGGRPDVVRTREEPPTESSPPTHGRHARPEEAREGLVVNGEPVSERRAHRAPL